MTVLYVVKKRNGGKPPARIRGMDALPPTPVFAFFAVGLAAGAFVSIRYPNVPATINPMHSAAEHRKFGWYYAYGSVAMLIAGLIVAVIRSLG